MPRTHARRSPSPRRAFPRVLGRRVLTALSWLIPVGLAVALAFALGTASARALLQRGPGGATADGTWRVLPSSGGAEVDPYTRARLTQTGAVPLGGAEGVVLVGARDEGGRPLDARCRYRLRGPMPPARRWSLWIEPRADSPARPGALHSGGLLRERGGGFTIEASRAVRPGNWLALPEAPSGVAVGATESPAPFTIHLALYDTPVARTGRADALAPPALRRIECGDATAPVTGAAVG